MVDNRIKVGIRIRPTLTSEIGKEIVAYPSEDKTSIQIQDGTHYIESKYDQIFIPESEQSEVFQFVEESIKGILKGYNCTILAYGQTGSGKTYTMFGSNWENNFRQQNNYQKNHGIVPRSVSLIFDNIQEIQQQKGNFSVYCSFLQIYNEKIYDLLQDNDKQNPLNLREDQNFGIFVENLSEYIVQNSRDCLALIRRGDRNRVVRQTKLNAHSSRSHTIFQILIESEKVNKKGNLKRAKINMCDLAGSEKFDKDNDMQQNHLNEMTKINLSLTTLGKVISALCKNQKQQTHVPYRDSKLTRLLQDSIGGNCSTTLIATISPILECSDETINTLKFADRAKQIMVRVKKNEIDATNDLVVRKLQREIGHLKELLNVKRRGNNNDLTFTVLQLKQENDRLRTMVQITPEFVENLQKENKQLRLELQRLQLQSSAARSTISTDISAMYNFRESELRSSQSQQPLGLQAITTPGNQIGLENQKTLADQILPSVQQQISQNQEDEKFQNMTVNNNQAKKEEDLTLLRCPKCTLQPPCQHYWTLQQLQQALVQQQQQPITLPAIKANAAKDFSQPITPLTRQSIRSLQNSKLQPISENSTLQSQGFARPQVKSGSDLLEVRFRTKNNLIQSGKGSVTQTIQDIEREKNRMNELKKSQNRLITLEKIEKYREQKLKSEIQNLENEKKRKDEERKQKIMQDQLRRKRIEEIKLKIKENEKVRDQAIEHLREREKLAAERKLKIEQSKKQKQGKQVRIQFQKKKILDYKSKKQQIIDQIIKESQVDQLTNV